MTIIVTYIVPNDSQLLLMAPRFFFAFIFISFLPGYCLVNMLFLGKNKLDLVEEIVLSVALSFGVDGLVGLFLGLSPIQISLNSITFTLTPLVIVFAAIAFIRKLEELPILQMQSPQQVSS